MGFLPGAYVFDALMSVHRLSTYGDRSDVSAV